MDSFLQQTAKSIVNTTPWIQMLNTTLVLPSHRAGIVLKDELMRLQQEQCTQAIWAPQVVTLTQLQDSLSPLYAEDELFTIVRLYKHYSGDLPLDLFYGWGRQILADFTNIDASMHAEEVPAFFDNTIAAHELEQWHLDSETEARLRNLMHHPQVSSVSLPPPNNSVKSQYEMLWRQLYDLYKLLRNEMIADRKGYPGMRQRAVIEEWNSPEIQNKIKGRQYIFVGFNYLLPVERELMTLLRDAGKARFYWDYVPDFQTNTKAFHFAKLNAGILGDEMHQTRVEKPSIEDPVPVTVVSCSSHEAQAQYVHQWLHANYTRAGQRIGIVICDETMLEPIIYALPAIAMPDGTIAPINITKGFPLRNTRIYATVLRWLNDRKRGDANKQVQPQIIDDLLAELFVNTQQETEGSEQSTGLQWQELLNLESEYQVRKIANKMRQLILNGLGPIPFTLKLLRMLMRRTMETITMPFHGEPVTDIQIMGVLETRMLDFDKLLMINVEEGVLPQRQNDISFIPYYLRKTYHMQTPDERATVYAYNFFRLLSRTGQATLLYASAESAEGGKGMSRFIMQMLASPEFDVRRSILQEPGLITRKPLVSDEQECRTFLSTNPRKLSPSALNTYISCPHRFYLQYVVGIHPPEKEDVFYAPNILGSFVHYVMEYIYRDILGCTGACPHRVTPEDIESVRTSDVLMHEALSEAYKKMNIEWHIDHPGETDYYIPEFHASENVIILGYVQNILEHDMEDARRGLQICLLESKQSFPVKIDGIGTIEVGGSIDRLDIYGSGEDARIRVIDYKSGSYNDTTHKKKMSSSWDELMTDDDKGYIRQTMIYSCAVAHTYNSMLPIEPNLYFCRHKLKDIKTTIMIDDVPVNDMRPLQNKFEQALQTKVNEILTTRRFPRCAEADCSSFCPFQSFCNRSTNE